jgi:serine/threonine protein kinase
LHSLAGSFGYVAPEVLSNHGHGKAVDMWSTGWVQHHLDIDSRHRCCSWLTTDYQFNEVSSLMCFCAATPHSGPKMPSFSSGRRWRLISSSTTNTGGKSQLKVCLACDWLPVFRTMSFVDSQRLYQVAFEHKPAEEVNQRRGARSSSASRNFRALSYG